MINIASPYPQQSQQVVSPVLEGMASFLEETNTYLHQKAAQESKDKAMNDIARAQLDVYRLGGELPSDFYLKSEAYKRAFNKEKGSYVADSILNDIKKNPSIRTEDQFFKEFFTLDAQRSQGLNEQQMLGYSDTLMKGFFNLRGAYQRSDEKMNMLEGEYHVRQELNRHLNKVKETNYAY